MADSVADRSVQSGDDEATEHRDTDYAPRGVERKTGVWQTLRRTVAERRRSPITACSRSFRR
jgi:hypothetical protein